MGLMSTGRVDHTISLFFLFPEVSSSHGDTTTVEDPGSDVHWEGGPHYFTIFFVSRGDSASWGHYFFVCRGDSSSWGRYYSGRPWVCCPLGGRTSLLNYFLFSEVTPPHGDTTTVEDHGSDFHWEGGPHY